MSLFVLKIGSVSKFKISSYLYCPIAIPGPSPYLSNKVPLIPLKHNNALNMDLLLEVKRLFSGCLNIFLKNIS